MNVLLFAPEYRPNMSSMIRSAEFFGLKKVYIYDQNGLLNPPTNKKGRANMAHMAKVWTAGAIDHIEIEKITDINDFLQNYSGRKVATLVNTTATHLSDFSFDENDLLIFGSEKEGIPDTSLNHIDEAVYLPAIGHTNCLNVAVTFGIVLHWAMKNVG